MEFRVARMRDDGQESIRKVLSGNMENEPTMDEKAGDYVIAYAKEGEEECGTLVVRLHGSAPVGNDRKIIIDDVAWKTEITIKKDYEGDVDFRKKLVEIMADHLRKLGIAAWYWEETSKDDLLHELGFRLGYIDEDYWYGYSAYYQYVLIEDKYQEMVEAKKKKVYKSAQAMQIT